jgi:CHAD domain-containing protein
MTSLVKTRQFICQDTVGIEEIESTIGALTRVEALGRQAVSRTYLDSFDRRIRSKDLVVQCDTSLVGYTVCLKRTDGTLLDTARNNPILPRRPRDVIQPRLRAALAKILGPRALLTIHTCGLTVSRFACRDKNEKIVATLLIEQFQIDGDTGKPIVIIKVEAKKGYGAQTRRLEKAICKKLPVRRHENDAVVLFGETSGSVQIDYTAKPRFEISKSKHTALALADVLSAYRAVMIANEEGTSADIDPEFLHDFRIAMRRSRSIFSAFKMAFPSRHHARFRTAFAWLSAQTSELRDLDVFSADLESLESNGDSDEAGAVARLREIVIKRRIRALQSVRRTLASKRYRCFRDEWTATLIALRKGSAPDCGKQAILVAANAAIWRRFTRIRKRIAGGRAKNSIEELHELRKDCKKLRYLIEAFGSLYPEKRVKSATAELKTLQDVLGRICDRNTQETMVTAWLGAASFEDIDPAIRRTLKRLHANCPDSKKDSKSAELGPVLSRFGSSENTRLYAGLFKP